MHSFAKQAGSSSILTISSPHPLTPRRCLFTSSSVQTTVVDGMFGSGWVLTTDANEILFRRNGHSTHQIGRNDNASNTIIVTRAWHRAYGNITTTPQSALYFNYQAGNSLSKVEPSRTSTAYSRIIWMSDCRGRRVYDLNPGERVR